MKKKIGFIFVALSILFIPRVVCAISTDDKIHFISSTTGDGMIIESNGHCGLVDALNASTYYDIDEGQNVNSSDNGTKLLNYANAIGCSYFDFVVLTHSHRDHIGGIPELEAKFSENTLTFYKEDILSYGENSLVDDYEDGGNYHWENHNYQTTAIETFANQNAKLCDLRLARGLYTSRCNLSTLNNDFIESVSYDANYDFRYDTNLKENVYFDFGDFRINLYNLYTLSNHRENFNSIVTLVTHKVTGAKAVLTGDVESYRGDYDQLDILTGKNNLIENPTGTCQECTTLGIDNQLSDVIGSVDLVKAANHGRTSSNPIYALDNYQPKYYITQGEFETSNNVISPSSSNAVAINYLKTKYNTDSYYAGQASGAIVAKFNDLSKDISIKNYSSSGLDTNTSLDTVSHFYPDGWKQIGQLTNDDTIFGYSRDGAFLQGLQYVDSKWYYFDENGLAKTGFVTDTDTNYTYYFCDDNDNCTFGTMLKGFQEIKGNTYYFRTTDDDVTTGPEGSMVTGLVEINNNTYYFDTNSITGTYGASLKSGCVAISGTYYCFDSSGILDSTYGIMPIPATSNCSNVVYNGEEQNVVNNALEGYTWVNYKGTDAGEYVVTASLKQGYKWEDGSEEDEVITCSIQKAQAEVPTFTAYSGEYDGQAHTITIGPVVGGAIYFSTNNEDWSQTLPTRKEVGTTTVYMKVVGNSNHYDSIVKSSTITILDTVGCTFINYIADEENLYIKRIVVNTDETEFKESIILSPGYNAIVDTVNIDDKKLIYTGGKTVIWRGEDIYKQYTNIVTGDPNGDGIVNSADLLKIVKHLKGTSSLSGIYETAADCNYDNNINSADLLKIVKYLKGTGTF